ncbi:MAG: hypothetical protein HFE81_03995 [Bacilli bacterium]|nr:hypothetical protein [Bacilli bacterium]
MYLKVNNKKIEIKEYKRFIDRFKSLKFVLNEIDYGIKIPNKKKASTYFFCQRVDICFTDKEDNILYLYQNIKSEKRIIKLKAKNVYYLPLNTCKDLKVGTKINLKNKEVQ